MRRLWIADVHANLPAFEAVLEDAGAVDDIVFLGDIVGYGPHPSACIDLLKETGAKAILGNHDAAILALKSPKAEDSKPFVWDEWTFAQLNESQLSYLATLPTEMRIDLSGTDVRIMHQPFGAPYIHPDMPDTLLAELLQDVTWPVIFCGHSHRQIDRTVNGCRYVCIPPVGQPRNNDPQAGYAVEKDGTLAFHFVPYDVERVVVALQRIGLPEKFCNRWISFLRTGYDAEWSREYKDEQVQNKSMQATPNGAPDG
jgi:predicted phosphodiesterase